VKVIAFYCAITKKKCFIDVSKG